jgi:transcriptional regulator with XRE-family HTH domain
MITQTRKQIARPVPHRGYMAVKRPATRETLARNLSALMDQAGWNQVDLSRRSGVSQRQISNILRQQSGCSVEHADALARAFGLSGWQLIMPTLRKELQAGAIALLIDRYAQASAEGRSAIDRVAELESRYSKNNH